MVNAKEDIRTWTQHFPVIQKSYLALESKYSLGNSKKLQLLICYEDKTNFLENKGTVGTTYIF